MDLNFLYGLNSDSYLIDIRRLLEYLLKNLNKICYISLNKSAESIIDFCKENNIDIEKIHIIDMVSPRFKTCKNKKGVTYTDIKNLENTLKSVTKIIKKEKCDSIILDSLSTMRIYYNEEETTKFAHELLVYTENQHIITNLIIQSKDEKTDWVKSLIPLIGKVMQVKFDD